jgi:hypothetical protein
VVHVDDTDGVEARGLAEPSENGQQRRRTSDPRAVQQTNTATSSAKTDLMRPTQTDDLRQRPASTFLPLVHTEVVDGQLFRATGARYQSVSRLLYGRRGMAMRSPSHPAGRGSDGLPSGPNSLFERGVTTEADGGRSSYAELSVILRCCSGNHLREPPCTLSQAPQDTSSHGFRRSSG